MLYFCSNLKVKNVAQFIALKIGLVFFGNVSGLEMRV